MGKRKTRPLTASQLEDARQEPFGPAVLGETHVLCLECGRSFKVLGSHLPRTHHIDHDSYKEAWGYNRTQPLMSKVMQEQFSEQSKRLGLGDLLGERLKNNPGRGCPGLKKRAQALPALIERNRFQAKRVPKGQASKNFRRDVPAEAVTAAFEKGMSNQEGAQALGCSRDLFRKRKRALGLTRPRSRPDVRPEDVAGAHQAGMDLRAMRLHFQCSEDTIRGRLREAGIVYRDGKRGCEPLPGVTVEAVCEARERGLSRREIAALLGCSLSVVRDRLEKAGSGQPPWTGHGTPSPRVAPDAVAEARRRGRTIEELASMFGCSQRTINRQLREAGVPQESLRARSDVTPEAVAAAWAEGLSISQIARRLKCDTKAVGQRLTQAGIDPKCRQRNRSDITAERIHAMRAAGMEVREIAVQLGCSRALVQNRLRPTGKLLAGRYNARIDITIEALIELRDRGMSAREMADHFNCKLSLIQARFRDAGESCPRSSGGRRDDVTVDRIREARQQGMTLKEMALHFQCGEATLTARVRDAAESIPVRHPPPGYRSDVDVRQVGDLHREGHSVRAIAEHFNCTEELVRKRLRESGSPVVRKVLTITVQEIMEMQARGLSVPQIAERVQCNPTAIYQRLKQGRAVAPPAAG